MKKIFVCLFALCFLSSNVYGIEPRGMGCVPSTWYQVNTRSTSFIQGSSHMLTNSSSSTQSYIRAYSRAIFSEASLGGSYNFQLAYNALGVNPEVRSITSYTITDIVTTTVAPFSSVLTRYGSDYIQATGAIKQESEDCTIRSQNMNVKYTYQSHVFFENV